jgi:hypothetical protein
VRGRGRSFARPGPGAGVRLRRQPAPAGRCGRYRSVSDRNRRAAPAAPARMVEHTLEPSHRRAGQCGDRDARRQRGCLSLRRRRSRRRCRRREVLLGNLGYFSANTVASVGIGNSIAPFDDGGRLGVDVNSPQPGDQRRWIRARAGPFRPEFAHNPRSWPMRERRSGDRVFCQKFIDQYATGRFRFVAINESEFAHRNAHRDRLRTPNDHSIPAAKPGPSHPMAWSLSRPVS